MINMATCPSSVRNTCIHWLTVMITLATCLLSVRNTCHYWLTVMITPATCPSYARNTCYHWLTVMIAPATYPSSVRNTCRHWLKCRKMFVSKYIYAVRLHYILTACTNKQFFCKRELIEINYLVGTVTT